jgi:hypothetical protein
LELCGQMELLPCDLANLTLSKCRRSQQLIRGLIKRLRRE